MKRGDSRRLREIRMKRFAAAVVLVVAFAVPAVAVGQTETVVQEPDRVVVDRDARVDFSEVPIIGGPKGSGIRVVTGDYKPTFKNLIQLRVSFNAELNRSVDNL